jgi:hypothetical protein
LIGLERSLEPDAGLPGLGVGGRNGGRVRRLRGLETDRRGLALWPRSSS